MSLLEDSRLEPCGRAPRDGPVSPDRPGPEPESREVRREPVSRAESAIGPRGAVGAALSAAASERS